MLFYSFIFGVLAWAVPVAVMLKPLLVTPLTLSMSFFLSAASVIFEFADVMRRAYSGDFAGIQDMIGAIVFGISVMLTVAALLNTVAFAVDNKRKLERITGLRLQPEESIVGFLYEALWNIR